MKLHQVMALALAAAGCAASVPGLASPRIPGDDREILERLPSRPGDPLARELNALRARVKEAPGQPGPAVALARRYFDLASAEGDPRYIGYAEAVLRPWSPPRERPLEVVFTGALLKQYRHQFAEAMTDLDSVLARDPAHNEALSWKWALHMVQADYAAARSICERRRTVASPLSQAACFAAVDGVTGRASTAYGALSAALSRERTDDPEQRQWLLTRLGELALRSGDPGRAERHFREAMATGVTDGFVLGAYADLLLDAGRHREVMTLLKDWGRSDILLLRMALAAQALGSSEAAALRETLASRFAAGALRGDKLHLQEEARFELQLRNDAARALQLALENWQAQREPRDARILMEAALAAGRPEAARPALEWMRSTGYEERPYRLLADRLSQAPGKAGR